MSIILYPILFIDDLLKEFGVIYFPMLLAVIGLFGPILWTSITRIRNISSVLYLEKITTKHK